MQDTITIYCKNNKQYYDIRRGTPLLDVYKQIGIQLPYPVVAALVNYKVQDLTFLVYKPKDIEFLDASCSTGMCCYVRTLMMVMAMAINELYPDADLRVEHPISRGYFCRLQWNKNSDPKDIDVEMIQAIKRRMQEIITADKPIIAEEKQTKEVMRLFHERMDDETTLFETLGNPYCRYFRIGEYIDYYTDALMPSTGYINVFELEPYHDGMLLRIPNRQDPRELEENVPQDKMFEIFKEYLGWNKLLQIRNVGQFNKACKNNKSFEMIKLSEALHEKKIAQIADTIVSRERRPKFIMISGPSSSGKTTFSKRLGIQLLVNGIRPITLSLDNYFVNRDDTPRDENGDWDFEHIDALDLPLLRQQIQDLMDGKEIKLPTYNFETGKREYRGNTLQLGENTIVVLEGLHALNPNLLPDVPKEAAFKIFVSCLTTVNLDNHNWIPTTDIRLIRRIVRDYRYRGYSARDTIARCPSVRRGEEKWIYPYQEYADVMFNSALLFELAVLKRHAEPILEEVPKYCDEYSEAHRLQKFLSYFESIPEREIPPTSFLREFVGGSSFRY
ncbi:MAG: nucleoside kinase [Paludibacteraceae bacterium]|jgi:uridine kinase|nr:nucleoside kinase [Paludibacteraceae bacterium]MBP5641577.1 nucleoside kinase [Paludibacteraceae bacterium]